MSSNLAMSAMSGAEFLLSAVLGFVFWKKGIHRRFPAMGGYLALRVISTPILSLLLWGSLWSIAFQARALCAAIYFYVYYAVYIASAVFLFFICMEVFRSALAGFSGLMRFGIVIFRWAVLASVIVTFSTVTFAHRGVMWIPDVALGLMRSVGILELCLLGFLCLSMNALRLSVRDLAFGLSLGFGLMAASDFLVGSFFSHNTALTASWQFVYQGLILFALGVWIAYAALPEPARQPIVVAASSTIYRWNEIASALGHSGTKVAVQQQPAGSFFLTDVEKVVEKVLTRNLKESETNL